MRKPTARTFWVNRRGNVAITFAFAAVPVIFALGASVDYGYAVKARAKLNAAADAAVLVAVTPQVMAQSTSLAQLVATQFFNAQAASIARISYDPTKVQMTVSDANVNNQRVRTARLTYTATSLNAFPSVLKMNTIAIGGTSSASASTSPNIDFYLMLDTSPSMAIPATQDGINYVVAATKYQGNGSGCAFACHEASPAKESSGATRAAPRFGNQGCPDDPLNRPAPCLDNYALAKNATNPDGTSNPILLRIDLVNQAVQNLVTIAQATSAQTGAAYRLAGYTFDTTVANPIPLQIPTTATANQAKTGINMLVVDSENSNNGDQNTVFDGTSGAFAKVTADMNAANGGAGAGNGTNNTGDHPQQVLMIVSDGVADEPNASGSRIYTPLGYTTNLSSLSTQTCTTIKANANVRIAVLYLVYNPLPMIDGTSPSWYAQNISNEQPEISQVMQNCASPGLFYQVNTGGDVSAAMNTLFQSAVKGARLTN